MQTVSSLWEVIASRPHRVVYELLIQKNVYMTDGTLLQEMNYPFGMRAIVEDSLVIERGLLNTGMAVGQTVSAQMEVSFYPTRGSWQGDLWASLDDIPRKAKVMINCGLTRDEDGLTPETEWLPLFTGYIMHRSADKATGVATIKCYDAMYAGGRVFDYDGKAYERYAFGNNVSGVSTWAEPTLGSRAGSYAQGKGSVDYIANALGTPIDSRIDRTRLAKSYYYVRSSATDETKHEGRYVSMRDVLGVIGAGVAYNWEITPGGALVAAPLHPTHTTTTWDSLLTEDGEVIPITDETGEAITVPATDTAQLGPAGCGDWAVLELRKCESFVADTPLAPVVGVQLELSQDQAVEHLAEGYTEDDGTILRAVHYAGDYPAGNAVVKNALLNYTQGYVYRPFEATDCIIDPAMECGDWIEFDGVEYPVMQMTLYCGRQIRADLSAPSDAGDGGEITFWGPSSYQSESVEQEVLDA